ncbi:conserved hypothetical protein [Paecilomyces variotii No. 5]|uniref:Inclusion body clearance protein IML2 n=1 Tax=Byssochlamys spectabilis (strain No. 5 / NBRC 109023) TaxID=1356009 RepID=V5I1K1_BYSSN|nr:conserved hypothetical protein [Paecilomyces variotii No. 5]
MLRVGSWLSGKKPASASTQSLDSLAEAQELENAMRAATFILNDDVDGAEAGLDKGNSSYHKLGKGVVAFVRATLGFEQEIMRQASDRLNEAETSAWSDQQRATHDANAPNAYRSAIYSPGAEYALCQAMAQLMGAVVAVLNESLTESIKGFYKLRKAYIALDGILQMEEKYLEEQRVKDLTGAVRTSLEKPKVAQRSATFILGTKELSARSSPLSFSSKRARTFPLNSKKADASAGSSTEEFHDAEEPECPSDLPGRLSDLDISDKVSESPASMNSSTANLRGIHNDPDSDIFNKPIDVFIHSGANLCFGVLLLIISMVPPAFSKLLGIIGFRGDKHRGLQMLWQASKFHNLMGAIAALALLGYYNGFVRYCDIIPDETMDNGAGIEGYPRERLAALLAEMRERFPKSQLWLLEESRMHGANKNLEEAVKMLSEGERSPLKQVEALRVFERSLNSMYLHKYELCSQSFLECVELNSWSRSLYYYIAGSAHVVLYRHTLKSDPSLAAKHAETATELLRKAPTQAGKKRFLARQLPFDVFVTRKIAKWESRAKEWGVPLVDAVGVDPIEEMNFFWNGFGRMTTGQLEDSLRNLEWSESNANKNWHREGLDEKAILAILRAAILRSLRRHQEAKELLKTQILNHDRSLFKGHLKDDWTCPAAHYEMAANLWMERPSYISSHGPVGPANPGTATASNTSQEDVQAIEREKVRECKEYLDKTAKWESYELDARIGLKVTAGEEALQKWEASRPGVSSTTA